MRHEVIMCCVCNKVRDGRSSLGSTSAAWQDFTPYLSAHQWRVEDVTVSQAYCTKCLALYQEFLAGGPIHHAHS